MDIVRLLRFGFLCAVPCNTLLHLLAHRQGSFFREFLGTPRRSARCQPRGLLLLPATTASEHLSETGFDTTFPKTSYKMFSFRCKASFLTGNAAFHSRDFLGFGRKKSMKEAIWLHGSWNFTGVGTGKPRSPPHSWGLPAACFKTCLDPRQGNIQHPSNQSRSSDKFVPTNSWGELSVVLVFFAIV